MPRKNPRPQAKKYAAKLKARIATKKTLKSRRRIGYFGRSLAVLALAVDRIRRE